MSIHIERRLRWSAAVLLLSAACSYGNAAPSARGPSGAAVADAGAAANNTRDPALLPGPASSTAGSSLLNAPPAGLAQAEQPVDPAHCASISREAQTERRPADIVFAVDNSGSMSDEIAFVREQLNVFSQQIIARGVDVRIIMISAPLSTASGRPDFGSVGKGQRGICIAPPLGSGQCPEDSLAPHYVHVPEKVGSHDALELLVRTFPTWQPQLRLEATKAFVVITDDDARPTTAAEFRNNVANLPGGLFAAWTFSGIYCASHCKDAANIGAVYEELVESTGGVRGDLCEQNFVPVFDALASAVVSAARLDCEWTIPTPPPGQAFDRNQVNVQYTTGASAPVAVLQVKSEAACSTRDGWYYDVAADPKRIVMCQRTCDAAQNDSNAKVDVLFGCETQPAPE